MKRERKTEVTSLNLNRRQLGPPSFQLLRTPNMSNQAQQETRSKRLRERSNGTPATEEIIPVVNKKARIDEAAPVARNGRKAHQLAQDYVELASQVVLHPLSKLTAMCSPDLTDNVVHALAPVYPLHHISALGFIKSAIRRPSVIERWSPYEIAVFEASLAEYGKDFHRVQKEIGHTKTTTDIVEFYYIWKKTSHYAKWKKEYIPPYLDVSDGEEVNTKPNSKR